MSEQRTSATTSSFFYRLFRRDIGRKLISLFLALLLYSAIDRQVSVSEPITVKIEYPDELGAQSGPRQPGWVLLVPARNEVRGSTYVVPRSSSRPTYVDVVLRGTKTIVDAAMSERVRLTYHPEEAGSLSVNIEDLRGLDDIKSLLGDGGVEFAHELRLNVSEEVVKPLTLHYSCVRVGSIAGGWTLSPSDDTIRIEPRIIHLRCPREVYDEVTADSTKLFRRVDIPQPALSVAEELQLSPAMIQQGVSLVDESGQPLGLEGSLPRAILKLERRMVKVAKDWASFDVAVDLRVDREQLSKDDQARLDEGKRLVFTDAEGGVLRRRIQVFTAETERDRLEGKLANWPPELRKAVSLQCLAEEANVLPGSAPIRINISQDLEDREHIEVRLVDRGEPTTEDQFEEIQWIDPVAEESSGDEDDE